MSVENEHENTDTLSIIRKFGWPDTRFNYLVVQNAHTPVMLLSNEEPFFDSEKQQWIGYFPVEKNLSTEASLPTDWRETVLTWSDVFSNS